MEEQMKKTIRRLELRHQLLITYGSISEAARKLKILNQKLSRFLSGYLMLNVVEMQRLQKGLKVTDKEFAKLIGGEK